jgi:NAD(P)-dependent dehydrogenase (short-subunit alcohol dehydrogenase family)
LTNYLVLINNAGIAKLEGDLSTLRSTWSQILEVNVTSVRIISELFVPLLQKSDDPRIINISSARGSYDRLLTGRDPGVVTIPYSCSKACLNFMTLQIRRQHPDIMCYAVSPGHCATALNGYRGKKDPVDGGKAAAELAVAEKGKYQAGFWEWEENGMEEIPW